VNPDQYSVPKRENVARVYSPVDFSVEKCLPPHLRKYEDDARARSARPTTPAWS
jgi:hypothetical protein